MSKLSVCFGLPIYDSMPARSVPSFISLAMGGGTWKFCIGTNVSYARNEIVKQFDQDYLVLLDADMVFGGKDVERLIGALQKDPGMGALSAIYVKRDGSGLPVCAWKLENGDGWVEDRGRIERAKRHLEAGEIAYVDSFGGGLLVATREAIDKVGSPWFQAGWQNGEFIGNDTFFCQRLKQEGFRPAIHFGVQVGHVGQHVYGPREN